MSDTPCKPVFVRLLVDTTINEGEKLRLHAAINAHPEPEVKKYISFFYFIILVFCQDYLVSK
jgi:hypothetical protein